MSKRRKPLSVLAVATAFMAMAPLLAAPAAALAGAFQQTLWNAYCADLDVKRQDGCGRYLELHIGSCLDRNTAFHTCYSWCLQNYGSSGICLGERGLMGMVIT
jgi:hypothetical protein